MSATIYGIAYKSVCDIKKTLALPNVKLSEWSYNGFELFNECLKDGGFQIVDQNSPEAEIMVWNDEYHNLFEVEYQGKKYLGFLLQFPCPDNEFRDEPSALALLMDTNLEDDYGPELDWRHKDN